MREGEASIGDSAFWAARLDRGALSSADQIEIDAWLAADDRNQGDLLRAQAALLFITQDYAQPIVRSPTALPVRRKRTRWLAVAASFALLCGVVGGPMIANWPDKAIQTAVGELRKVPLADGTIVTMNTATMVEVRMKPTMRELRLEQGEAMFEVARDSSRPFVVQSANVSILAVGTAFTVRRRQNRVEIHVVEGIVETWIGANGQRKQVRAGERAVVSLDGADIAVLADVNPSLAWREGFLEFNNIPLAAAIEDINRYNSRKIILDDDEMGQQTLVGSFRANDPDRFAHALKDIFDARIAKTETDIRISSAAK